MDAYTIGLLYLALYITNKMIDLLTIAAVLSVASFVGIIIAVIGRRKK